MFSFNIALWVIYKSLYISIGLDNGLVPIRHQAIIQTNADLVDTYWRKITAWRVANRQIGAMGPEFTETHRIAYFQMVNKSGDMVKIPSEEVLWGQQPGVHGEVGDTKKLLNRCISGDVPKNVNKRLYIYQFPHLSMD